MDKPNANEAGKNVDPLTIVGIGASAGGLTALKKFFSHIPPDSGLTYVVVVHLSPEHKSLLAELLQPHVSMPVQQVTKTVALKRNHAYVIPPGCNLESVDTHLRLAKLEEKRRERAPIDHFFRTMAKTHDGNSVGVILTGTGSDGSLGLKEIKLNGGLTIVQDPAEAEYDGMPQSAIATGIVDAVLLLDRIPPYILKFTNTKPRIKSLNHGTDPDPEERQTILKIYAQVRARTGRDFSRYKLSTILRRLERRMQIYQIEILKEYLVYLRANPKEVSALSDDFLINVTSFFRDPEVFDELQENVIPGIFEGKSADHQVRIWSVGCATGEEAYSLAILLYEEAGRQEIAPTIQIFASDLHEHSLAKARDGFYPGDIEVDVSAERLRRFFHREEGGYRIRKEIREMVVFTPHNLLGDPPFSRIDLIVCRNLLIYLKREVQRDVFELFHYALQAKGVLVLGSSEHLERTELFRTRIKELSIYAKRDIPGPEPRLPVFPQANTRLNEDVLQEKAQTFHSFGALHQNIVEHYAPPSILLSSDYQIQHVSETAGRYLQISGGELSRDIFKMVLPELHLELRTTIYSARDRNELIRSHPLKVDIQGRERQVILSARVVNNPSQDRVTLLMFEEYDLPELTSKEVSAKATDEKQVSRIKQLEDELNETRQRIQAVIEEYETSREEMKASNEELQSANEELRSTMEELETSKEELQSMNEELTTLNQETRHKVEELGQLSDDLHNLLAATDIATLFLDKDMRILRFTPKLGKLFNVRLADRGRLITDQTNKLGYEELLNDAQNVLKNLVPIEREVSDTTGSTYLTRVLPYRSSEDRIDGVVITFVDITERKKAEEALRESELRYRLLVKNAREYAIFMVDLRGRIMTWNTGAERLFGYTEEKVLGQQESILYTLEDRSINVPENEINRARETGQVTGERYYVRHDKSRFWASGTIETLLHTNGAIYGYTRVLRDNSERKRAEEALREEEWRHQQALRAGDFGTWDFNISSRTVHLDRRAMDILNVDGDILSPGEIQFLLSPEERTRFTEACMSVLEDTTGQVCDYTGRIMLPSGRSRWIKLHARIITNPDNQIPDRALGLIMDVTSQVINEKELKDAKEEAEKASTAKDDFLATMSHEIRTPLNAINGLTHLLLNKDPRPDQKENLETLKFSTHSLLSLINDILYYSKLEAQKVELDIIDYELSTILKSIRLAHLPFAEKRENTLIFNIETDVPPVLKGDPNKLVQVLNNLISNANKFTEDGTVNLNVSTAGTADEYVSLTFSVKDTGVGISKEKLQKIFDKFTQADSSTMRRYGGTGLGLTITKSLLELMGSSINVSSEEGRGTDFYFTIKQLIGNKDNINLAERRLLNKHKTKSIGNKRILLAEDADINRLVIQQYLYEWWDTKADEAINGREAVDMCRNKTYDLVLMDKRMPEMDGIIATSAIRKLNDHYAKVPVIVLTADISLTNSKDMSLFDAVITKPFNPEQLMSSVLNLIQPSYASQPASETETEKSPEEQTLYTPDFHHAELIFGESPEKKKDFYVMAVKTIRAFREEYLKAADARDPKGLNDVLHSSKMLFDMLGLNTTHKGMYDIYHRLAGDNKSPVSKEEKEEVDQGITRVLDLIDRHRAE
ncbi:MAG: CheR family methyltransferase [Cyclobacteriaceae bacterium]